MLKGVLKYCWNPRRLVILKNHDLDFFFLQKRRWGKTKFERKTWRTPSLFCQLHIAGQISFRYQSDCSFPDSSLVFPGPCYTHRQNGTGNVTHRLQRILIHTICRLVAVCTLIGLRDGSQQLPATPPVFVYPVCALFGRKLYTHINVAANLRMIAPFGCYDSLFLCMLVIMHSVSAWLLYKQNANFFCFIVFILLYTQLPRHNYLWWE